MNSEYDQLKQSLVTIGAELFRFQRVFDRAISKLPPSDRKKYDSQFAWFTRRVAQALETANLRIVDLTGEEYDPGMALTPLNLDDFAAEDPLFIQQMVEPIVMEDNNILKTGTVLLGRIEK